MVLTAHSDAAYLNETRAHSYAGSHIFFLKSDHLFRDNGHVLSMSQIINVDMSSASEEAISRTIHYSQGNGTTPTNT